MGDSISDLGRNREMNDIEEGKEAVKDVNDDVINGGKVMEGSSEIRNTNVGIEKGMDEVRDKEFPGLNEVFPNTSSFIPCTPKNIVVNDLCA